MIPEQIKSTTGMLLNGMVFWIIHMCIHMCMETNFLAQIWICAWMLLETKNAPISLVPFEDSQ